MKSPRHFTGRGGRALAPVSLVASILLSVVAPPSLRSQTTVGQFTGADAGEGLDLQGDFVYAVNVGTNGAPGLVGDAEFTEDNVAGVTIAAINEIPNWHAPDYGFSIDDDGLEIAMASIRWTPSASGTPELIVTMAGLEAGATYRLQLLFAEQCCPGRGFDVIIGGSLEVDDFIPADIQGGAGNTFAGAVVTHDFVAGGPLLEIRLDGNGALANPAITDGNSILNAFTLELVAESSDSDADGLPDEWEMDHFGNLDQDGTGDPDADGLDNAGELAAGTQPTEADTDGDGLEDGAEVNTHGSNPLSGDSDGDTLGDAAEVNTHGTNPALADSDGDLVNDNVEIARGVSSPTDPDSDDDGFDDLSEIAARTDPMDEGSFPRRTVPGNFTGGDPGEGLDLEGDIVYAFNVGTPGAPFPGTAGDAEFVSDFDPGIFVEAENEIGVWNAPDFGDSAADDVLEFVIQSIRWSGRDGNLPDTVNVTLEDLVPGERYQLQLLFGEQCCAGRAFDLVVEGRRVLREFNTAFAQGRPGNPEVAGLITHVFTAGDDTLDFVLDGTRVVDPAYNDFNPILNGVTLERLDTGPDSDGDGLPDGWEIAEFGDLAQDGAGDPDADGLDNAGEYREVTDPNAADTDGDELNDGAELVAATDPVRADSDGDGLEDGPEVALGADPDDIDTDGDGLLDGPEVTVHGTSPILADTDGDTFDDPTEIGAGSDPNDPESIPSTYPVLFMGGDPGEGADFEGIFLYAVNVGPDFPLGPVGDADFTDDAVPGVVVTAVNNIGAGGWGTPDYGDTVNDDNLEFVMQSIRWSPAPQAVDVQLSDLTVGQRYKLQLLFGENCCWRAWDIFLDGELALPAFSAAALQGGPGPQGAIGVAVVHEFTAESETFGFVLDGTLVTNPMFPDHNAILNGFTLEAVIPDEAFRVTSIERDEVAGEVRIQFTSTPGAIYAADYKETLDAPFWEELSDGIEATSTRTGFVDTDADRLARPTGFYRFREL